jgi:E3 ubiquitin-protein ligase RNF217
MICSYCSTQFCYRCGCRFRSFRIIGDHYSKLSVLGCKYRFYPENSAKRKAIRGSILCGKVIAAPLLASAVIVVGAGVLTLGCLALPIYGTYKLAKHIQVKSISFSL